MTGPLARAVAVALVGFALGFLPGAVAGAPQESDEIPIKVQPSVAEFVSAELIRSLRAKLDRLVANDEIERARVEITHGGRGKFVVAVVELPSLKASFSRKVRRKLLLTVDGWDRCPLCQRR